MASTTQTMTPLKRFVRNAFFFAVSCAMLALWPWGETGPLTQAAAYRSRLRVATLNMYVGFDMAPVVDGSVDTAEPGEVGNLVGKLRSIYENNRPKERARALARELVRIDPDVIDLQEAAFLSLYGFTLGDAAKDLAREIRAAGGADYGMISLGTMGFKGVLGAGKVPVPVGFEDREVVLYRKEMRCRALDEGLVYRAARRPAEILGEPVTLKRGVIGMSCYAPSGRPFYLYNTHLDVASQGAVQEAQARELTDYIARTAVHRDRAVIVTGDFNAREDLRRTRSYAVMREAGFRDAFRERHPDAAAAPGITCCQDENLRNAASVAGARYDYVFFSGKIRALDADTFADARFPAAESGELLWPSDHFGVWADFEWPLPKR